MRNYRNAFVLALIGNVVFIGVLAGIWWTARRTAATQHPAAFRAERCRRNRCRAVLRFGTASRKRLPRARPTLRRTIAIHRREVWGG